MLGSEVTQWQRGACCSTDALMPTCYAMLQQWLGRVWDNVLFIITHSKKATVCDLEQQKSIQQLVFQRLKMLKFNSIVSLTQCKHGHDRAAVRFFLSIGSADTENIASERQAALCRFFYTAIKNCLCADDIVSTRQIGWAGVLERWWFMTQSSVKQPNNLKQPRRARLAFLDH